MKRILLVCNGGFSTSMLMSRMEEVAQQKGIDIDINAIAETDVEEENFAYDILLLGPQIGHRLEEFSDLLEKPVYVIDSYDYGTMNGEAVLDFALSHMEG